MAPASDDISRARSGRLFTRQVWSGYAPHTLWRGLAAKRLGVARVTLCRWAREGRFPGAVKFARAWYIPKGAHPRRRGFSPVMGEFDYETAPQAAERLGVALTYVIRLVESGLLEGERGPWRDYAIKKGAEPIISMASRRSRRPDILKAWRLAEEGCEFSVLQ